MLRWYQLPLRFRNNYGATNAFLPWISLGTRHTSYAVKLHSREVESTYAGNLNISVVSIRPLVHSPSIFPVNSDPANISDVPDDGRSIVQVSTQPGEREGSLACGAGKAVRSEVEGFRPRLCLPPTSELVSTHSPIAADTMERPPVHMGTKSKPRKDFVHPPTAVGTVLSGDVDPGSSLASPPGISLSIAADVVRSLFNGSAGKFHRGLDIATLAALFNRFGPCLLRELDENQSSELLCLFGSMSDALNTHKYHSRYRKWVRNASQGKGHWDTVRRIVKEKEVMGHDFGERDNFWSMRAYLEQVKGTDSMAARKMARLYYLRTIHQSHDPFVHIIYFDTLLSHRYDSELFDAVDTLSDIIGKESNPHRGLVALLWKVVLFNGNTLPPTYKARILNLFQHRPYSRLPAHGSRYTSIHDLVIAFAATFFPCYQSPGLPAAVSSWATACARTSVTDALSMSERFSNLVLLAMYHLPQALPGSPMLELTAHSLDWRAVLGTAILDTSLGSAGAYPGWSEVQNIARSFWRLWKDSCGTNRPREVDRAVVISFVRIATKLRDGPLLNGCASYILSRQLWCMSPNTEANSRQVEQLFAAFADGLLISQALSRDQLLFVLREPLLRSHRCAQYFGGIFRQLVADDVNHAHQLYLDCLSHGIRVPPDVSIFLAQSLAFHEKWDDVVPFLTNSEFSDVQLERLLETVLSVFQATRQEFIQPVLAEAIGDVMQKLYHKSYMLDRLKGPARFFLPIMVASRHPQQAVQLLEILLRGPATLTPRFFARMIHTLISHRQHGLAVKALELASTSFQLKTHVVCGLRRKTLHGLVQGGALQLARRMDLTVTRLPLSTLRDRLLRANTHSSLTKLAALRFVPAAMTHPIRGPTTLATVQLLVKSGHLTTARRVIRHSYKHLKPEELTALGNIYLHGPLLRRRLRNKRLMRYVLRTKDFLMHQYGFKPDRTTVNIIIKATLRWRVSINLQKVKSLFDHLIRHGYPASERWRTIHGVPFGSPAEQGMLDFSGIRPNMSFKRHIRPLYKMFIKEFFLRKDRCAAHRVVGILKEEEVLALQRKEERERVRRLGIAKRQRRRALERG